MERSKVIRKMSRSHSSRKENEECNVLCKAYGLPGALSEDGTFQAWGGGLGKREGEGRGGGGLGSSGASERRKGVLELPFALHRSSFQLLPLECLGRISYSHYSYSLLL